MGLDMVALLVCAPYVLSLFLQQCHQLIRAGAGFMLECSHDFRQVVLSLLRAAHGAELPSAAFNLLCQGGVPLEGCLGWALLCRLLCGSLLLGG